MKKKGFIFPILLILITMVFFIIAYKNKIFSATSLGPTLHTPINILKDERLFFYREGFAISGVSTQFYDGQGNATTPPLINEGELGSITAATSNYMLLNGKTVYKTSSVPFEELYSLNDSIVIGMKEFEGYLLLSIQNQEGNIEPKLFHLKEKVLQELGDLRGLYYIDAGYHEVKDSASILTLDLDAPFPSTKILHYNNKTSLYGVISVADQFSYRIFRLPSNVIVMGNHQLACYNIEGGMEWNLKDSNIHQNKIIEAESELFIYFKHALKDEDGESFNTAYIDRQGQLHKMKLPSAISAIKTYKKKFVALQHGKNVLIINKNGTIDKNHLIKDVAIDIYWNPYQPDLLYIINRDRQIQIYSTKQEESK